jgi:hypothetical protein
MKRLLLATTMLGALATTANADLFTFGTINWTLSQFAGVQQFGTVTVEDSGGGVAHVTYDVSPNFVVNTGGPHSPLAFNLSTGSIVESSISFAPTYFDGGAATQQPFGNFANSINSTCAPGGSGTGACHVSTLEFDITGFTSFFSTTFNTANIGLNLGIVPIFFAGDILAVAPDCTGTNCTGNVGGYQSVPGPIAGASIPGLVMALLGMVGLQRRRKAKLAA